MEKRTKPVTTSDNKSLIAAEIYIITDIDDDETRPADKSTGYRIPRPH